MKKEPLYEKLIKRIYGISGPLDEHKRREADHIGNKVFMILSLPQLTLISSNWKYYILLTIAILSSITYLYYLYQFVKETK